jgi:hypothetical protein
MEEKKKRPYHKPQIERVRLRPEEAVLGGCKTAAGGGWMMVNCLSDSCFTNVTS